MRTVIRTLVAGGLVAAVASLAATASPQAVLEELRAANRERGGIPVHGLVLGLGQGELRLDDGMLYVLGGYRDSSIEAIFLGQGSIRFTPPDAVEAGQLDLFTGASELDELITEITFVACRDEVVAAIRALGTAGDVDLEQEQRAQERFAQWTDGYERELLGAEIALLHDALGDPVYGDFFAATLKGEDLGDFLFSIDLSAAEPVTLGQFVRQELTKKEERKSKKALHKAQRQGRFIGVDLDEFGVFDTWVSSGMLDEDGVTHGGTSGFAPRHYEMTVDVSKDGRIDVVCNVMLESLSGRTLSAAFELDADMKVKSVLDASGNPLFHYQLGHGLWVFLEHTVASEERIELEIRYGGPALDKISPKVFTLRNTTGWYPRTGHADLATYDVTFSWPTSLDLVASGKTTNLGKVKATRSQRQQFNQPVGYFTFEMGDYDIEYFDIDDVRVTMAWDRIAKDSTDDLEGAIKEVIGHILRYYDETFGDYPFDFLTTVTVPRDYAQSLPGFVTLPSSITTRQNIFHALMEYTDPRLIIAHELAHQWWGHLVMWDSYRDQWISEAMASYAAAAWMRASFNARNRPVIDLTAGWKSSLEDWTSGQRTVDSLGPLVLGQRLESSQYSAYVPIVYEKGAVVLNTLALAFGEEAFLKVLSQIVKHARGKIVSTDTLIEMIERITGQDLDWFRDRCVYGTGIPKVYYSYEWEERDAGTWNVSVDLEQEPSFIHRFKLVRNEGAWDFEISSERMFETEGSLLAIPVQIRAKQEKEEKKTKKKRKSMDELVGELARAMQGQGRADEQIAEGKIVFRGTADTVDFDLPFEPDALWLDRRSDVYAKFYNSSRWPRSSLERQGIAAENAGDYAGAAELYGRAIETEYHVPLDDADDDPDAYKDNVERGTVRLHLLLAELHLRSGEHARAGVELDLVEASPKKARRIYRERVEVARSRLDLGQHNYQAIVNRLRKRLRGSDRMRMVEGYAVLAVAAHETGNDEIYEKASRTAEKNGVDISALTDLRED